LLGGAGKDTQTGGLGHDAFVFNTVEDSANTALCRDRITYFYHNTDTIDLAGIDTNTSLAGRSSSAFSGSRSLHPPAVRHYSSTNGTQVTRVLVDVNGDAAAEFAIDLTGNISLTTEDFLLYRCRKTKSAGRLFCVTRRILGMSFPSIHARASAGVLP
jgi:serralysin